MRDLLTLLTCLALFLGGAVAALVLSAPAWRWAERGGTDLHFWPALAWTVICYVAAMLVALRLLDRYRRHEQAIHRANSVGRSQKS